MPAGLGFIVQAILGMMGSQSLLHVGALSVRLSEGFLVSQDHISIPDPTPPSSPEPDMLSFIAENSALIAARETFSDGLFNEVLDFISSSDQPERLHEEFQELWTETIYRQASAQQSGKVLNAVDRYRLRKRKPFPRTIWNGDQSRHLFKESSRNLLQEFFDKNPYPTPEEKRDLTRQSQLSYSQVSNFFKNRRGRQLKENQQSHRKMLKLSWKCSRDDIFYICISIRLLCFSSSGYILNIVLTFR